MITDTARRVWLALLAATGLSTLIFETQRGASWVTTSILVIAAVKIALVMAYFMEVRTAHRGIRIACAIWLLVVAGMLVGGFAIT